MEKLDSLKAFLSEPKRVVLVPHRKPDADALGSCLGLMWFLRRMGHDAHVVSPTDYPQFLDWMPGQGEVLVYGDEQQQPQAEALIAQADLIGCLDFSALSRIEAMEKPIARSAAKKLLIDHHRGKEDFADFELWDIGAAATAELIFDFIDLLGRRDLLNLDIAACLYAGIMTDTGSFKFPSTSPKVHRIVADLLELGLDAPAIHRAIHDSNSLGRLRLLGFALCNRLQVLPEYKTAYFALSWSDLQQFNYQTGDAEGLVNYALSVKGMVMAALFVEDRGFVKMSFRSVGDFSVNDLARDHFNGGGHLNAAGGRQDGPLKGAVDKFLALLPQYGEALGKG
jgi:phosphoesterase RecJ-like protein